MERINSLCRILAAAALSLLIGVGAIDMLPHSEAAKNTDKSLEQQIYEIQTALNEDNKDKIPLFEAGSLNKDYTDEQLEKTVGEWILKASKGRTYSDEALNQIKKEIISLYKKQKEIASDPIYTKVSNLVFQTAPVILIACLVNIVLVFLKQHKRTKETENISQSDDITPSVQDEISSIENGNDKAI